MQPDLRSDERKAIDAAIASAVQRERERCAEVAETFPAQLLQFWPRPRSPAPGNGYRASTGSDIAAAIRGAFEDGANQQSQEKST